MKGKSHVIFAQTSYSAEEYLAIDPEADYKSEYVTGEIFAMGGASPKHVLIAGNTVEHFVRKEGILEFSESDDG